MKTRMEKEIYLMLHTTMEAREILRMPRQALDWWVTTVNYMLGIATPGRGRKPIALIA